LGGGRLLRQVIYQGFGEDKPGKGCSATGLGRAEGGPSYLSRLEWLIPVVAALAGEQGVRPRPCVASYPIAV